MVKINKTGFKILAVERDYSLSSYGTGGTGYIEHRGLKFKVVNYNGEIFELYGYLNFSSKGYANLQLLEDKNFYPELNGRMLEKHNQYRRAVVDYDEKYTYPERLNRFLSDRVVNSKAALKNWFKRGGYYNDYPNTDKIV